MRTAYARVLAAPGTGVAFYRGGIALDAAGYYMAGR
jgi:hypothetical protein